MSDRDQPNPDDEIYLILGEAGEPQAAFADKERAESLRDRWQSNPVPINVELTSVSFDSTTSDESETREHTDRCPEWPNIGFVCAPIPCPGCGTGGWNPTRRCPECDYATCWCVGDN